MTNWTDPLSFVLLGISISWRSDLACSPAELVYGTSLRLPREFASPKRRVIGIKPSSEFLKQLKHTMCSFQPFVPTFHGPKHSYIPKDLVSPGYVYVWHDAQRKPLQRTYDGLYRIIDTAHNYFTLAMNGKHEKISVERLKLAHVSTPVLTLAKKSQCVSVPTGYYQYWWWQSQHRQWYLHHRWV